MFFGRNSDQGDAAPQPNRLLPIYIVIDCSGGMVHQMAQARGAADQILAVLSGDDRREATVIGLILFNDEATRFPLTPFSTFRLPELKPLGKTQMGKALKALNEALDTDLVPRPSSLVNGSETRYFQPLVFLISDGDPSLPEKVEWRPQAEALKQRTLHRPLRIVALAIGPDANHEVLNGIADISIPVAEPMEQLANAIREHIRWEIEGDI